tara:strand:+ start:29 stop:484 length:456 start_codon:yes stop_codon:yes gene_type:complete
MIQDSVLIEKRHKRFITKICESEIVYGLENQEGFATSSSIHYEDEEGKPVEIICFWAEKSLAKSCIKDGWADYEISKVSLSDFLENWCIGMDNDGLLVGTEFDQNMFGFETEPLNLILDLCSELKSMGKDLELQKFQGISDLESQVKAIVE